MKKIIAIALAGLLVIGGAATIMSGAFGGSGSSADKEVEYRLEDGEFVAYIDGEPVSSEELIVELGEGEDSEADRDVSIRLPGVENPEDYSLSVDGIEFEYQNGSFNALLPPGTNLGNVVIVEKGKDTPSKVAGQDSPGQGSSSQGAGDENKTSIEEVLKEKEEAKKEVDEKKETENKPELSIEIRDKEVLPGENLVAVKLVGVESPEAYELYFEGARFTYHEGEFLYVVPNGTTADRIDVVKK